MYARPLINSLDFARNGRTISGEVPFVELSRMQDMLDRPQGVLSYSVRGGVDEQGTHFLELSAAGLCMLRCQRCLGGLDFPVQIDTRLLLRDRASLDVLDDRLAAGEDEEFDSILADAHMDLLDLLEEEIILGLPIAPKHEPGICRAAGSENRHEGRHPFAILANLKSN